MPILKDIKASYLAGIMSKPQYINEMFKMNSILFEYSEFIKDTDIARIEISDGLIIITFRSSGIKVVCDKPDKRAAPMEVLNFGYYEKNDWKMALRLIGSRFSVFDIGANVGWLSLNLAKIYRDSRIFAFEPIPSTFGRLKRNVELNNLRNLEIYNFGFSDHEGDLKFYVSPNNSANASLRNLSGEDRIEEITCRVRRLDDFMEENDQEIDFIKCDVEGAELLVFRGGARSIARDKPIIFTEMLRKWSAMFNYHPNEIMKLLGEMGYRCFTVQGHGLVEFTDMNESTMETNFFFLHSEKHAAQIDAMEKKWVEPS